MKSERKTSARAAIRRYSLVGLSSAFFLVGGLGGWAAVTELSGAVVAPGSIVVDSYVKKVQHPAGGVVGEILARDGDRVRAGDVVVRLDETVARASLAMVSKSLDELAARQSRLEAERDGAQQVAFPAAFRSRAQEPELASLIQGEINVFQDRREARAGQKAQLQERIAQLQEQIDGLKLQASAKGDEIQLIQD
ncbi:MAG: hemolysin secretion protein, partial [Microvirga sp.]|nr:hemolysin secretion protein [Microvirga sp.]